MKAKLIKKELIRTVIQEVENNNLKKWFDFVK